MADQRMQTTSTFVHNRTMKRFISLAVVLLFGMGVRAADAPTVAEAQAFLDEAEQHLLAVANESSQASWVQANFITDDTEALAALANDRAIKAAVEYAKGATRFDKVNLPADMA